MKPVYQFIADYAAQKLDYRAEFVVGSSFDPFANDEVDVGFISGLPYVLLMEQPDPAVELLAAPVLQGERYADRPIYFSDVIVQKDSMFQSFADLRGQVWGFNGKESQSGYGVVRYHLSKLDDPGNFFERAVETGSHANSIEQVASGDIDAAAIDSHLMALEQRENPDLTAQLRILGSLGPSTVQPVVAAVRLSDTLKARLRDVFLSLADDPIARQPLDFGMIKRFVPISDADYDDIRAMWQASSHVQLP